MAKAIGNLTVGISDRPAYPVKDIYSYPFNHREYEWVRCGKCIVLYSARKLFLLSWKKCVN